MKKIILILFLLPLFSWAQTTVTVNAGKYAVSNFQNGTRIHEKETFDYKIGYNDSLTSVDVVDTVLYANETRPIGKEAYLALNRDSIYSYFQIDNDSLTIGGYGTGAYPVIDVLEWDTIAYPNVEFTDMTVHAHQYPQQPQTSIDGYYVSSSTGDDSYSGLEPDSAWQTLSKVSSTVFQPGDTILLKAGDSFDGRLLINDNGTGESPIVVTKYGIGDTPIIYGDHPNATYSAVDGYTGIYSTDVSLNTIQAVFDSSNVKFNKKNQGTQELATFLNSFSAGDWGFTWDTGLTYVKTIDGNTPSDMRLIEYATVRVSNKNYIVFDNLDIRNGHMGLVVEGGDSIIIKNSNVQDMQSMGIYIAPYLSNMSYNCEITNNTITRTGWTTTYLYKGGDHWVHHNTMSYAQDTILDIAINGNELAGVGLQEGQGNIVEYNDISYMGDGGADYYYETGSVFRYNKISNSRLGIAPHGTGLKVYYNEFNLNGEWGGVSATHAYDQEISSAPSSGPNEIYNNTFYNFYNYGFYCVTDSNIFKNNLMVEKSNQNFVLSTYGEYDYNGYYNTAISGNKWKWNGTTYTSLAAYQSASGQDANSFHADPLFTDLANGDFTLQTGSPAINAGTDVGLTQDINGNPIVGAPDIGSYEYQP